MPFAPYAHTHRNEHVYHQSMMNAQRLAFLTGFLLEKSRKICIETQKQKYPLAYIQKHAKTETETERHDLRFPLCLGKTAVIYDLGKTSVSNLCNNLSNAEESHCTKPIFLEGRNSPSKTEAGIETIPFQK